jgi:DNA topoisomerase-3
VFFPAAEYLVTTRITRVAGEPFKSEGKVLVEPGWLAVYGKASQEDEPTLAAVEAGEKVATEKVDVVKLVTRPPPRFNEATLLSAMEGAGKQIEDEELREAMREKGLGTPATRAQIIEGLLLERYIYRDGRELVPTAKAFSLMTLLSGLGIPELVSPELTAEWEYQLAEMEHGRLSRTQFMREIVKMTQHIVAQAKNYESDTIPGDFATLAAPCPKCGGEVHEKYKKFQCVSPSCDFGFWKILGGRQLEPAEAEALIRDREVGPLEGFRSRLGRGFAAKLRLTDALEVQFDFGQGDGDGDEAPDFTGQAPLGPCPKCSASVFETANAYVCEKAVGADKTCDFRSGRTILSRSVEREQMQKLLATGRTDLLQFVSARTKRPFSAFLVRQPDGKVGFEFEARDPSKKGRPQRAAALRSIGTHPADGAPVELYSGRYGPYVKHGGVNATVPEAVKPEELTLAQALELLAAKGGKAAPKPRATRRTVATKATAAAERPAPRTPASRPGTATAARAAAKTTRLATAKAAAKPPTRAAAAKKTGAQKPAAAKRTPRK